VIFFLSFFFSASYPTVQGSRLCSEFNAGECFSNAQYCGFSQFSFAAHLIEQRRSSCVCVFSFFLAPEALIDSLCRV